MMMTAAARYRRQVCRDGRRRRRPQAIATAAPAWRRGHRDRCAARYQRQVESLGAKFLAVEDEEFKNAQTAGGSPRKCRRSHQASRPRSRRACQERNGSRRADPGPPGAQLVSAEMVKSMKPGSVLVDLAVERGGNVEGARPGEVVDLDGIKIAVHHVAGRVAAVRLGLYARTLFSFIETLVDKANKALAVNWTTTGEKPPR